MEKKDCMKGRVGRLVDRIIGGKTNVITFLDTGAFIDFEREVNRRRIKDKSITSSQFYSFLRQGGFSLLVTEGNMEEIRKHYSCKINGNTREISDDTYREAERMHNDYCELLKSDSLRDLDFEKARFDVYWAGLLAFSVDHKKGCFGSDPISKIDRDLVSSALWARHLILPEKGPVNGAVIISPDCHILYTNNVLMGIHPDVKEAFNYNGVKVISSR